MTTVKMLELKKDLPSEKIITQACRQGYHSITRMTTGFVVVQERRVQDKKVILDTNRAVIGLPRRGDI
jgi:hypothetical protein